MSPVFHIYIGKKRYEDWTLITITRFKTLDTLKGSKNGYSKETTKIGGRTHIVCSA